MDGYFRFLDPKLVLIQSIRNKYQGALRPKSVQRKDKSPCGRGSVGFGDNARWPYRCEIVKTDSLHFKAKRRETLLHKGGAQEIPIIWRL
jgi:hypothetical protein